jgi:membrane-associated phospholipid phosphatase
MSTAPLTAPSPAHALRMPRLSRGGVQVGIFLLAYLVYSMARYVTVGSLPDAEAGALWLLYKKSRPAYERLRNTVLATWLISIPVYALFPVAPPRLAGIGMVDTITQQTGFAMDSSLTTKFYNELAAVPSLHVGFAFAVGIALAAATSNRWLKLLAHLWGPAIALAVVATGNHFVFDIVAGMVAAAFGYGIGVLVARAGEYRARLPLAFAPA